MDKTKRPLNQQSILDFFKRGDAASAKNSNIAISRSLRQSQISSPRKRKRAISSRVKKIIKSNKKKKVEAISISDSSEDNDTNDEILFQLEEDACIVKNEVIEEILSDWHTPEKVKNVQCLTANQIECKFVSPIQTYDKENNITDIYRTPEPVEGKEICITSNQKEYKNIKLAATKKLIERTTKDDVDIEKESMSCSNSSSNNSVPISRIWSPERTPTPSPCHDSNYTNISPYIKNSPGKFNLNKVLSSPVCQSPYMNRSAQKATMFANSPKSVKRQLNLDIKGMQTDDISSNSQIIAEKSPSKYRKVNGLYLDNFLFIMSTVMGSAQNYSLFNESDRSILENFQSLSLEAKKLYIRLFQRKVRWLQFAKIQYADICEKEDTYIYINELIYSDLLHNDNELQNIDDILNILEKKGLKQLCKEFKVNSNGTRENIMNNLIRNSRKQKTISSLFGNVEEDCLLKKRGKALAERCCMLSKEAKEVFMRILTLFSLPSTGEDEDAGQQSQLKILLMEKLGKVEFPSYDVLRTSSIFANRESLIQFSKCYQMDCNARELMERKEWHKVLDVCSEANVVLIDLLQDSFVMSYDEALPCFLRKFTSVSVLLYMQDHLVNALQKLKKYDEAVKGLEFLLAQKVHLQDSRGRWYDRLALNYDQHLKNPQKALEVIMEALSDPEVMVGHRLALSQRAKRILHSKKGKQFEDNYNGLISIVEVKEAPTLIIQANSLPADVPGFKRIYISNNDSDSPSEEMSVISSVEELVLTHYKKQGYQHGLHGEGRSIRIIFGLLFWDCIYASVPDVFMSAYQAAPLDLNSRHFYEARKQAIDERLANIRHMDIEVVYEDIEKTWKANEGKVSVVNWDVFHDIQHLMSLIQCLGIELIASICERLCKNHRFTRSGFPDLIVWNPIEKTSRIVEVKGPNDKLSTKQMLWLEFLINNGATAEVCHVEALGARRLKQ